MFEIVKFENVSDLIDTDLGYEWGIIDPHDSYRIHDLMGVEMGGHVLVGETKLTSYSRFGYRNQVLLCDEPFMEVARLYHEVTIHEPWYINEYSYKALDGIMAMMVLILMTSGEKYPSVVEQVTDSLLGIDANTSEGRPSAESGILEAYEWLNGMAWRDLFTALHERGDDWFRAYYPFKQVLAECWVKLSGQPLQRRLF